MDKLYTLLLVFPMQYFVTEEWVEDPTVSAEEFPTLWEQMVRPSLETLDKMV